jgi:hypothetical protein
MTREPGAPLDPAQALLHNSGAGPREVFRTPAIGSLVHFGLHPTLAGWTSARDGFDIDAEWPRNTVAAPPPLVARACGDPGPHPVAAVVPCRHGDHAAALPHRRPRPEVRMSAPRTAAGHFAPVGETAAAEAVAVARRLGPADALVAGVLDIASARTLALDALLRVSAVQWSAEIATACVECADRPRILLNPLFVERFCGTRERLAFLLLHECSHISLGHTRLFPRPTALHNLAFDAVINASLLGGVAARVPDPGAWTALVEETYDAAAPPWFLLRPPPGWPERPDREASAGCPESLREIHRRLYPEPKPWGAPRLDVTYTEIVSALASTGAAEDGDALLARLLGSHGATEVERAAETAGRDARAAEMLEETLRALGVDGGAGAGAGAEPYLVTLRRRERERVLERALGTLLRRVFVEDRAGTARWIAEAVPTVSPDPTRDRRAATRREAARRLGAPEPLLFRSEATRFRTERRAARVYLDVSGSMYGLLERLHAALVPLRRLLAAEVFAFSTEVVPVSWADLVAGRLPSTGGTSVEPVLHHLCAPDTAARGRTGPRHALVLTDGYFCDPSRRARQAVAGAGHRIHLGVLGAGPLHDRAAWVASSTRLPDPIVSRR